MSERAVEFWELQQGPLMVEATFQLAMVMDCANRLRRLRVRFDELRPILHPFPG